MYVLYILRRAFDSLSRNLVLMGEDENVILGVEWETVEDYTSYVHKCKIHN